MTERFSTARLLTGLRAAGEVTRLRILALLSDGELNVSDITRILNQSQPRISRHLRLLMEARLVERFREGSWVFFRLSDEGAEAALVRHILSSLDFADPAIARDRRQAQSVKRQRAEEAQAYFRENVAQWDRIRALHVAEDDVEQAMIAALGPGPFGLLVDLGTGTGRILELFASRIGQGIGIDILHEMLSYARLKLAEAGLGHCHVRQGDLYALPFADDVADIVIIHQVLHFLDEPGRALGEAARILAPGGQILVVDFAPHELEFLRDEFSHRRLGFEDAQMRGWLDRAGFESASQTSLAPSQGSDAQELTVSLWQAKKPKGRPSAGVNKKLERTL